MTNLKILLSLIGVALALALWIPTAMGLNILLLTAALVFAWLEHRARSRIDESLLASQVFETSSNGILISDARNRVLAVNPAFCAITGYTRDEIVGATPHLLSSGRHDSHFYDMMWQSIKQNGVWQGEIWNKRKNGDIYAEWLTINSAKNARGKVTHHIAVFSDITERKTLADKVEYLATHDALTGLPNRALLAELLSKALADASRADSRLAVFFLDLDRFKLVNDTLGHGVGDDLLKAVAARLQDATRAGDMVARQGGDEFIMALPNLTGIQDAAHIAGKIVHELGQTFDLAGHAVHTSSSIGIAMYPEDGRDALTLLKHADAALYHAKELGRNNFQFFKSAMNINMQERLTLERDLRIALERAEFRLHFQPQFELASGCVIAVEALLRWQHPERGLLEPAHFLSIAEESGMINAIGEWAIHEACEEAQRWHAAGHCFDVIVNVSAVQLRQNDFAQHACALISNTGLAPAKITLSMHENTLTRDTPALQKLLHDLHQQGMKLMIGDFGSGYSNLSTLKRLPIDRIKIDCLLLHDLPNDANAAAIVEAILRMGESLGLEVVAEGVESESQQRWLMQHGCRIAQGFHLAAPMAAQDFLAFIDARRASHTTPALQG